MRGVWLALLVVGCGGSPPPPTSTCPTAPRDPIAAYDERAPHRVSGVADVKPSDQTKVSMVRKKIARISALASVCVTDAGRVSSVCFVERSGFDEWDDRINETLWNWRFSPSTVDGKPVAACTEVGFIYRQW